MLELRLCEPATPVHVERAGRLFGDALSALGVSDEGVTLVVENDQLRTTVRTRTPAGAAGVQAIIDLVQSPVGATQPGQAALAEVLASYARDERRAKPQLRQPGTRGKLLCSMDETFANTMDALAKAANTAPAGAQRVRGTTYVHTRILRVGRTDDRQQPRVRISVDGRLIEVALSEGLAAGPFFDAAKSEQVVRVRLRASWVHVTGQRPVIRDPLVVGIDEARAMASGARIVEIAAAQRIVAAGELPALLSSIDRSDEDDT